MNRRSFMLSAGAASAQVIGANDRIRGAVIGSGGRGRLLTGEFKEIGVEMNAVCDIYEPNLQAGLKVASSGAKSYDNYKRMLESKDIDVVIVATPDHWHAQMVIDAVNAGKDVYVEKPMAHLIPEGFDVIDAVRRTKRVVQVGTQRRSFDLFQDAKRIMDSGQLGEVRLVTSQWLNHTQRLRQGTLAGKLDWNQWIGSAPKREMDPFRFLNWYYFYDYSGGLLVGQAAHIIDAIQWFMNSNEPLTVTCSGGKPNLEGAEVPETATIAIEYPENYLATFTIGYKAMRYAGFNDQLKQFHGSQARFDVAREWYRLYPESREIYMRPSVNVERPGSFGPATRAHIRNFLECVRSRKDPTAPVEAGQATNIVLVMALDSLRSGKRLRWNSAARRVES
ncbi:MAG: Gfo/Idh/MocA family oxidoreductase [Bryobacterales bacterium]|nr:Gfo/Idh/MocA family oxidoreductase [Bryobacterales bacterium]